MTSYRVEYTEIKPGGHRTRQCDRIVGTVQDVRDYLNSGRIHVYGLDPIVITEHTKSDGIGRDVPASEWDVYED